MDVLPPFVAFGIFQAGEEGRKNYFEAFNYGCPQLKQHRP